MNVRGIIAIMLALLAPLPTTAQGFAGLGADATGFATPDPDTPLVFPADHGPHPDYRIEWWYLTANLSDAQGRAYGIQWTLFRSALAPGEAAGWQSPQVWLSHAALTTPDAHYFAEKFGRGGTGQAGVTATPFAAWIDDWAMKGTAPASADALSALRLNAQGADFAYDLKLAATGPLVLHGTGGYSVKSAEGQASYYYSQPFYEVSGTLTLPTGDVAVTGTGWLDREWSSQPLAADQSGWDWLSLTLADGARLMGFRLRGASGDFTSGTWIDPDGTARALPDGALILQPLATSAVAGRNIPTRWRVQLPETGLDVTVRALNPRAWMGTSVPYWEGPVSVSGSHEGKGYLEMTGYPAVRAE
jgi:predicted secreted hydrolase